MKYLVYIVSSPSNKVYIGMTSKTLEERSYFHKKRAKSSKTYFANAINKYGDNLTWEILEKDLSRDEAESLEKHYIAHYDSANRLHGYNGTIGGTGGAMSEDAQERQKSSLMKYYENPENRMLQSELTKLGFERNNSKQKMSEYWTKFYADPENRKKQAYRLGGKPFKCIETNEVFQTLAEAEEALKIKRSLIGKVLNGKRYTTHNLTFSYLD